tara:strand:- start:263 stop:1171 length:909 start_codon:yes stop_codon:yes gene_type:complete
MITLVADSTALNLSSLCGQKYFYEQVLSLVSARLTPVKTVTETEGGAYLNKGDLLHTFLRIYYKLRKRDVPFNTCRELALEYGRTYAITLHDVPIHVCEHIARQFSAYCEFYRHENWKIVEVEHYFAKELYRDDEIRIIYEGIIDLFVEAEGIQGAVPVDHKSSKRRQAFTNMGNQFKGYCWASGANRCFVNKVGFQKTLAPKERFQREPKHFSRAILDEWKSHAVYHLKELAWRLSEDVWPMDETSCDKFGGCSYRQICETPPSGRGFRIFRDYSIRIPWNPAEAADDHKREEDWLDNKLV